MINKHYFLGLAIVLATILYTLDVQAPCCEGICYVGGKCCGSEWYIGCNYIGGVACPNDVFDSCIVCECTSPNSCNWVDYGPTLCPQIPQCQICTYDNLNNPSFSTCSAASDCSINNTCYSSTQSVNGSCCCGDGNCGADHVDDTYATICLQNGDILDTTCYYDPQTNVCTAQGWTCSIGNSINCTIYEDNDPSDNTLIRNIPTINTCTSICNAVNIKDCCYSNTVICDNDCSDNFCVTATSCGGSFNVGGQYDKNGYYIGGGVDYYCHNDNGVFYINTDPAHPAETCDDSYNNNCDGTPDGGDIGCAGSCIISSPAWSPSCAFEGDDISLTIQGNEHCRDKSVEIAVWKEDENGNNDTTFGLTNWPQSPVTFPTDGAPVSIVWSVERPNDETGEDALYMFRAWIGGASVITDYPLIVKYCAPNDADCDGESDNSDECPDTPSCAVMDEESAGCSIEQAKTLSSIYDVPGFDINAFSFLLVMFVLTVLLVYNFERNS